jgi:pre-mRNA-splicing helicase BRR2
MVDVITSSSWLNPGLAAMELSQMVVQAMWTTDHVLKQIPHFTEPIIRYVKSNYEDMDVFGLLEMEDEDRDKILGKIPKEFVPAVANACNRYPSIEMTVGEPSEDIVSGEQTAITVQLVREIDDEEDFTLTPVTAPFYPEEKVENWWLVLGDKTTKTLYSTKIFNFAKQKKVPLRFFAPAVRTLFLEPYFFVFVKAKKNSQKHFLQAKMQSKFSLFDFSPALIRGRCT